MWEWNKQYIDFYVYYMIYPLFLRLSSFGCFNVDVCIYWCKLYYYYILYFGYLFCPWEKFSCYLLDIHSSNALLICPAVSHISDLHDLLHAAGLIVRTQQDTYMCHTDDSLIVSQKNTDDWRLLIINTSQSILQHITSSKQTAFFPFLFYYHTFRFMTFYNLYI